MKSTIDSTENEHEGRRGIFRRGRRGAGAPTSTGAGSSGQDVSEIDDIARRMSALSGETSGPELTGTLAGELDLQRAAIARANRTASTPSVATAPVPTNDDVEHAAPSSAPTPSSMPAETHMPVAPTLEPPTSGSVEDDIQARLEAVLAPTMQPQAAPLSTTAAPSPVSAPLAAPVAAPAVANPTPVAEPISRPVLPLSSSTIAASSAPTAAALLGIDVDRMITILEDEARSAQQRIELEIRGAHTEAAEIVARAESESERIREHGQNQARVLLSEVEEIISEAQATGEQILVRANDESISLRNEATSVLHQAQGEARAIIENARREGEQVLAEQRRLATVRAQEAMREQDRLKDQIRRLEERRRQVLESLEPLIAQLTQMMPTDAAMGHIAPAAPANVVQLDRTRTQS